jgi:hypothetical protein
MLDLGAMHVKDAGSVQCNIANDYKDGPLVLAANHLDGLRETS